jgi:hypothetical protein
MLTCERVRRTNVQRLQSLAITHKEGNLIAHKQTFTKLQSLSITHKLTITMSNPFLVNGEKVREHSSQKTGSSR